MSNVYVNWYDNAFGFKVDNATEGMLDEIANQVLGHAQVHISANGQVDTGFLRNSGYVVTPKGSSYGETSPDGTYTGEKSGSTSEHAKDPESQAPKDGALVAFAANYAIYQEMRNSFLYRGLEDVQSEGLGKIVSRVVLR